MPPKNSSRASSKARRSTWPPGPKEREIYEAAARIIFEKGFTATTNQDIADEVGMLKGSLYYYIDVKEDLLYGVMRMAYDSLRDHLTETAEVEGDEIDRLRYFITGYTQLVITNRIAIAVLEREMRSLSPRRRRAVISWRDEYEAYLRDLLTAGREAGLVRDGVDVELQSIMVFTQLHGLHTWYRPDGARSPEELADLLADFVLHGLLATG